LSLLLLLSLLPLFFLPLDSFLFFYFRLVSFIFLLELSLGLAELIIALFQDLLFLLSDTFHYFFEILQYGQFFTRVVVFVNQAFFLDLALQRL